MLETPSSLSQTLSADGIFEAFPVVIELVNAAPTLTRWNVVKFRQRKLEQLVVNFQGLRIEPKDVCFSLALDSDGLADITLFIEGDDGSMAYVGIGFLFLDNMLGEYDVEMKVGNVEFKPLDAAARIMALPIQQLPATFDALITVRFET
jgi:hypothetical protein